MPRYRLTIAYDGTDFSGWQRQRTTHTDPASGEARATFDDTRTVQRVLERAVMEVVREPIELKGASRTDAGVHANAQVAAFTCSDGSGADSRGRGWPLERGIEPLVRAINSRLPDDVLVASAAHVPDAFDPVFDCIAKGYSYTYFSSPHRTLWDRRRVFHTWVPLDLDAMNHAARCFEGEHDFAAFAAAGHGRATTVRTIFRCALRDITPDRSTPDDAPAPPGAFILPPGRLVRMEIAGSGFLYNMVRIIAGTLHEVGRGRLPPTEVPAIIASATRASAGPTLPASGLCLEWIRYRPESLAHERADPSGPSPAPPEEPLA